MRILNTGSSEEITVTTEGETWIPETDAMRLRIGIYGRYAGESGSGRFGIKNMDNVELVRNYFALRYDDRRDIEGVEGDKWLDIFSEVVAEVERRYFALHNIPDHFIEFIMFQSVDWDDVHYDEMAAELAK